MAIIDATDKCNLRCIYCCRSENDERVGRDSDIDEIIETIKQLINSRGLNVVLQGGEPLLKKDVDKLIQKMSSLKIVKPGYYKDSLREIIEQRYTCERFSLYYKKLMIEQGLPLYCITTNGMIYSEDIANDLYSSGFSVEVSLDSHNAETNMQTRIGIDFDKVIENIRLYAKYLPVEISCTITEHNAHEIDNILPLANDLGCICVKYSPVIMIGQRKESCKPWVSTYLDSVDKALDRIKNNKYNLFLKVTWYTHFLREEKGQYINNKMMATPNVYIHMHECGALKNIKDIYVDTDLNVYGCASMKNYGELIIGNLRENSLKEIWNSQKRLNLKEKLASYCGESIESGSCTAVAYGIRGRI